MPNRQRARRRRKLLPRRRRPRRLLRRKRSRDAAWIFDPVGWAGRPPEKMYRQLATANEFLWHTKKDKALHGTAATLTRSGWASKHSADKWSPEEPSSCGSAERG